MRKILLFCFAIFNVALTAQTFNPTSTLPLLLNTGTNYSSCASPGTKLITFEVSGLSNLNTSNNQLYEIHIQMNAGGVCGSTNIRDVAAYLQSPSGTCVRIATQFGTTTNYSLANRRLDYSFINANGCLNNIPNYSAFPSDVFSANNVSGRYGYFRTDGDISATFNGENPNGTWNLYFFTSTASPPCVTDASLVFGEPTVNDYRALGNDCANAIVWDGSPACLSTVGKTGSLSMPGFATNTTTTTINGTSCEWNASRDNDSWLKFTPTSSQVCITISGLSLDLQSIVVKATSPTSCTDPHPGGGNDTRWELISCPRNSIYGAVTGTTRNHTHCFTAIPCEEYYLVVDGNAGAESDYFVTGISGLSTLPTVTCPDDFSVCITEAPFALSGATPSGGTYSGNGVSSGVFSPSDAGLGTHIITYEYEECAGTVSCTFEITVTTAPDAPLAEKDTVYCSGDVLVDMQAFPASGGVITWYSDPALSNVISTGNTLAPINTPGTTIYYVTETVGSCESIAAEVVITIIESQTPVFDFNTVFCEGESVPLLPDVSVNGITGSWNPSTIDDTQTGDYTFTPDPNQCAQQVIVTVTITDNIIPLFSFTTSYCEGATVDLLPATSDNNITGSWNPSNIDNTQTADYTFTPDPGQCSSPIIIQVTIEQGLDYESSSSPNTVCNGSSTVCEYNGPLAIINEIMMMPGTTYSTLGGDNTSAALQSMYNTANTGEEWVEIYNPNPCEPLDLECFVLGAHTTGSNFAAFSFPPGTVIPPLGFIVVGGGNGPVDINLFDYVGTPYLTGSSRWHLENGCGYVMLANPQGNVVNAVYWSTNNDADLTAGTTCGNSFNNTLNIPAVCSPPVNPLPAARNVPVIEYAGNFGATAQGPSVIGRTISRSVDGGSSFVLSALGGTPGACNSTCEPPFSGGGGTCNGTATVNVTDGSGSYSYLWDSNAGSQTTATATDLCAGEYCVEVTDNLTGCTEFICITVSNDFNIDPPLAGADATYCEGDVPVDLTATANNSGNLTWYGNATLTDTIGTGTSFTPFIQTGTRVYYVTETVDGCESPAAEVTIVYEEAEQPLFSFQTIYCEGTVTDLLPLVSDNGITGTWNPSVIDNMISGDYEFTPSAGQCANSVLVSVTITDDIVPVFSFNTVYCEGSATAVLPPVSDNGISGTWNPSVIDNMVSGDYEFVPDGGQCSQPVIISVTVTDEIIPEFSFNTEYCEGATPASLPLVSDNGVSGTWSPSVIDNTQTADYTFTPDGGQCSAPIVVNVVVNELIIPVFSITSNYCEGDIADALPLVSDNGISGTWNPSIIDNTQTADYTFTPDGGQCSQQVILSVNITNTIVPSFSFQTLYCEGSATAALPPVSDNGISGTWNPSVIDNMVSGDYEFVPDGGQCSQPVIISVTVTDEIIPEFSFNTEYCEGATPVSLPLVSDNGVSGTWSPSVIDNTQTADYTFTPDGGQCSAPVVVNVVINNAPVIAILNVQNSTCGNNNGEFTVNVSGGLAPFNYSLNSGTPQSGGNTLVFDNLTEGNYNILVSDANGCSASSSVLLVNEAGPVIVSVSAVDESCAGANDGALDAIISGGTGSLSIIWQPGNLSGPNHSGLSPGLYTLSVIDQNNCTASSSATIAEGGICCDLEIISLAIINETCSGFNDGSATVDIAGGNPPYVYEWNGIAGGNSQTGLFAGSGYTLTVVDQDGCEVTRTFDIAEGLIVEISAGENLEVVAGSSVQINTQVSGSISGTYSWTPAEGLSCNNCPNPVASPLTDITYNVIYTDDIGCSASDSVDISVLVTEEVFCLFPDAFTPNNDNVNDIFKGICDGVDFIEMRIYNRWGELVFQESGSYPLAGWDGIYKGREAPVEVYVYYVYVEFFNGTNSSYIGNLTLIR
jgi:gliding motility-associated-like protein